METLYGMRQLSVFGQQMSIVIKENIWKSWNPRNALHTLQIPPIPNIPGDRRVESAARETKQCNDDDNNKIKMKLRWKPYKWNMTLIQIRVPHNTHIHTYTYIGFEQPPRKATVCHKQ